MWLAAIWLLVLWWARVPTRFLVSVHCIAVGVVPFPVARWALQTFLRRDSFWVAMVVKIEPSRWIEVEGGRVDFVEIIDLGVEVFFDLYSFAHYVYNLIIWQERRCAGGGPSGLRCPGGFITCAGEETVVELEVSILVFQCGGFVY
jgi:hypothetical protein